MNRKRWANSFDADTQQDTLDHKSDRGSKDLSAESQTDKPNRDVKTAQKWDLDDWDADDFDSDRQNMSLVVILKLANQLSLLKQFLEIYNKFNVHLGCKHNRFTTVVP